LNFHVIACAETGQVAGDKHIEVVAEHHLVPAPEPAQVRGHRETAERHPSGKDGVNVHQDLLGWCVDEDVARAVDIAVVVQLQGLATHRQRE
jgi:hypothetical protein